jgi:hypothetical protein
VLSFEEAAEMLVPPMDAETYKAAKSWSEIQLRRRNPLRKRRDDYREEERERLYQFRFPPPCEPGRLLPLLPQAGEEFLSSNPSPLNTIDHRVWRAIIYWSDLQKGWLPLTSEFTPVSLAEEQAYIANFKWEWKRVRSHRNLWEEQIRLVKEAAAKGSARLAYERRGE